MAPASLSSGLQSFTPIPTINLGTSGASCRVGGFREHSRPLWVSTRTSPVRLGVSPALPQPPRAFSIRGLRLYFPEVEPCAERSASLPAVDPVYLCTNVGPRGATHGSACLALHHSESGSHGVSVRQCGATGSPSGNTACGIRPTLRQCGYRHSHASPLNPGARLRSSHRSGRMFIFYFLGVGHP